LYRDPFDEQAGWGLVTIDNNIVSVYSTSAGRPLTRLGVPARYALFEVVKEHKQWRFVLQTAGRSGQAAPRFLEVQAGRRIARATLESNS
jgi:hypothetical protein